MISGMPGSMGRALRMLAALLAVSLLLASRAHAFAVDSGILAQSSVLVSGSYSAVYSFNTTAPGVLVVRLENLSWPERLAQLDCSIFSGDALLGSLADTGEFRLTTTGPLMFYATVRAGAAGLLNLGLFSFRVTFEPIGPLVPLPAAFWLLASALGGLGLWRRLPASRRFAPGGASFA